MNFTDSATISGSRTTPDGYLVGEVRCARTGLQQYLGLELGLGTMDVINVYRPEAEVFHKDSLASYAHKPISDNHPPTDITAENWKQYAGGDVGSDVMRDGDFVKVPYKLMDAALIRQVRAGKAEVSMGYTAELDFVDGVTDNGEHYQAIQRNIRINHLAIVDQGRAGEKCRIGDSAKSWGTAPLTVNKQRLGDNRVELKTLLLDGLTVETTDQGAIAVKQLSEDKNQAIRQMADAKAAHLAELELKDKALAAKDAEIDALKAAKLTDADIDAKVQARSDLVTKARMVAKDAVFTALSDEDIKKTAVTAALGEDVVAGKTQAYIDARFDILCDEAAKGKTGTDSFADAMNKQVIETNVQDNGYAAYVARQINAWKGE